MPLGICFMCVFVLNKFLQTIIELFVRLFQFLQEKARGEEEIFYEGMTDYRTLNRNA